MKRHRLIQISLAAVALMAAVCAADSQHTVALTGVTVWDGSGGPWIVETNHHPTLPDSGRNMASLKIEFEKGGTFTARMLEDEAPKTCATIRSRLPVEYLFQQSIVSGQAMVAIPPDLTMGRENQRVAGIPPGALSFLVKDEPVLVPDEIYIAYGIFISRGLTIDAKQPVNVFAQIDEGLDELKEIGARIIRHGAETVRFSLAD